MSNNLYDSTLSVKNKQENFMRRNKAICEEIADRAKELGCRVSYDEKLAKHTTFKVGGSCNVLIFLNSVESSRELFSLAIKNKVPYLIIGKGSNLLVDDNGFDGVAFIIGKDFAKIRLIDENTFECDAGVPLAKAAYFAYENSLTGFEFAWGIPGNVGGAVFMNAGAYGGEIKDIIVSAQGIDSNGNIKEFKKDDLKLSYRHSIFTDESYMITKAVFRLKKGDKTAIRARMDELMGRRKSKQPLEFASAGSTFKRPEGSYASLLIEQCGLKGFHVGDAEVSTKHSGFVINKGNASCKEIIELIEKVKEIVFEKTGYKLESEVRIIVSDITEQEN